jgi:hypothetical protein
MHALKVDPYYVFGEPPVNITLATKTLLRLQTIIESDVQSWEWLEIREVIELEPLDQLVREVLFLLGFGANSDDGLKSKLVSVLTAVKFYK